VWGKGYPSGGKHAIEEMKFSVPKSLRHGLKFSKHYGISDYLQNLINNLFTATAPILAASHQLHQIMQRTFLIAGNYSRSILDQIKRDLLSSMVPPPGQTEPITRKELYQRIQNTLNVSNARAENIARTETTNAYNSGRIETMQRSSLCTHWRFLAILDTRTTAICESRNGLVYPIEDTADKPALHYQCRSVASPLLPAVNPSHAAMVDDPNRNPANRTLAPLLPGWRTNV
jgi:SPP1 gp7 family putative phage head morphogenesis protein